MIHLKVLLISGLLMVVDIANQKICFANLKSVNKISGSEHNPTKRVKKKIMDANAKPLTAQTTVT